MSFLKKLFGGKGDTDGVEVTLEQEDYKGFTIKALLMTAGREYQLAGVIEKQDGDNVRSTRFIRADRLQTKDDAASAALAKGRQIIDEQGDSVFASAQN